MSHPIAIIGAGMAGLACARALADAGVSVTVFEKSRGPGGRMSARRTENGGSFDHGAQYFTAWGGALQAATAAWARAGAAGEWEPDVAVIPPGSKPRFTPPANPGPAANRRWVGVPGMNAPLKELSRGVTCLFGTRIESVAAEPGGILLRDGAGMVNGPFAALVCSAPAPQTAELLASIAPDVARMAGHARMSPCWAVMAEFDAPVPVAFDAAFVNEGALGWMARNSSKPGRPAGEAWILHASHEWSESHVDMQPHEAGAALIAEFARVLAPHDGLVLPAPRAVSTHRWRFAITRTPVGRPCLAAEGSGTPVVACGDWCLGPRVEDAHTSGLAAASFVLENLPASA
jgi:predicted NAD/FAD-dependent oxidoreductase